MWLHYRFTLFQESTWLQHVPVATGLTGLSLCFGADLWNSVSLLWRNMFAFSAICSYATLHPALSEAQRKRWGEIGSAALSSLPSHWFAVFDWFSPPPPPSPCAGVCGFYTLYHPLLTHLPYASSFHPLCFDLVSSVYPHNLFCSVYSCTALVCSVCFLFSHSNISGCWLEI